MDKIALEQAAKDAGATLQYDEEGNIINYTEELNRLVDEYDKMVDDAMADGDSTEEEESLKEAEKKINDLKEAISRYDDTRDVID
jgi:KaiC/GvpD/RAD55 family RecA-like ATPase